MYVRNPSNQNKLDYFLSSSRLSKQTKFIHVRAVGWKCKPWQQFVNCVFFFSVWTWLYCLDPLPSPDEVQPSGRRVQVKMFQCPIEHLTLYSRHPSTYCAKEMRLPLSMTEKNWLFSVTKNKFTFCSIINFIIKIHYSWFSCDVIILQNKKISILVKF